MGYYLSPFILLLLIVATPGMAAAGEIFGLYGATNEIDTPHHSFAYQVEYREGLGENLAASASYLNEGHVPDHHRDGLAPLMLWGRVNLLDRRLSLAAGAGPYLYADTTRINGVVKDDHGVGGLMALSATLYTKSRFLLQGRVNWVATGRSIDTLTTLIGIGYQLDPPRTAGQMPTPPTQREKTTDNELSVYFGQKGVNNPGSPKSLATCIEYRRGLLRYLDVSAAWLNEGDNDLIRRNGPLAQFWLVRSFLDDHLSLGGGIGSYIAISAVTRSSAAGSSCFCGHIGGDDFIVISGPHQTEDISSQAIKALEDHLPMFHGEQDFAAGCYSAVNRKGEPETFGLLSISIGIVNTRLTPVASYAQLASISTEVKKAAKKLPGSSVVINRRSCEEEGRVKGVT